RLPEFPEIKVPKRTPRPVAAESFERLLDKAGDDLHLRALLLCGWLAGLRVGEARTLEWEENERWPWVDFGRNRIWLPAAFVRAVGARWFPWAPQLRGALRARPRQGKRVSPWKGRDGGPMSRCGVGYKVRRLARRAGVRLSMRTLRRGFGCRYAG